MSEFLTSYAGVIALVCLASTVVAGLLLADANDRADRWQTWAEELEDENDRLRARLNDRPGVVALRPRREVPDA